MIFLRFPVTSFVPVALLLVYFRGNPYRIGVGNLLNRMWVHIVPLAILFVVAAASSRRWGYPESESKVGIHSSFCLDARIGKDHWWQCEQTLRCPCRQVRRRTRPHFRGSNAASTYCSMPLGTAFGPARFLLHSRQRGMRRVHKSVIALWRALVDQLEGCEDSRNFRFWLFVTIFFWLLPQLFAVNAIAQNYPYIINDDARLFVVWLRRFSEPAIYPNDSIAQHFIAVTPWLYQALYWPFGKLGIDPLIVEPLILLPAMAIVWSDRLPQLRSPTLAVGCGCRDRDHRLNLHGHRTDRPRTAKRSCTNECPLVAASLFWTAASSLWAQLCWRFGDVP